MYLKITNEEENHYGLQYKTGLIVDPVKFSKRGTCCPGGIYFTDEKNLHNFLSYGVWIREVTIPEDAKFVKDSGGDKWRANKVILGPRRGINGLSTWVWLKSIGVDLANSDFVSEAIDYDDVRILDFLLQNGADGSDYLGEVVNKNNVSMVNCILRHIPDIDPEILFAAYVDGCCDRTNLKIVKALIRAGLKVYDDETDDCAIIESMKEQCNKLAKYLFKYVSSVYHESLYERSQDCADEEMVKWLEKKINTNLETIYSYLED